MNDNARARYAIVGGTGLDRLDALTGLQRRRVTTPYGEPAAALSFGTLYGVEVVFLPRHGDAHALPPHKINYRANVWALKQAGVERVIAVAAVGGIGAEMTPGRIAIPDQLIDYTWGREQTFFDDGLETAVHVDFSYPYDAAVRDLLIAAGRDVGLNCAERGVYGATQGPRLETAAEIERMRRDGCDLVGMTGMPEAVLAREAGLDYACCSLVVNWAAGVSEELVTADVIGRYIDDGMADVRRLLERTLGAEHDPGR